MQCVFDISTFKHIWMNTDQSAHENSFKKLFVLVYKSDISHVFPFALNSFWFEWTHTCDIRYSSDRMKNTTFNLQRQL